MLALLLAAALPVAAASEQPVAPAAAAAPAIAARAWLLIDYHSGQTLAARNADQRIEPASLTKLMTAYLTFSALRDKRIEPGQTVSVSKHAWQASGSRMFIEPNKPVTVDDLMRGMIVQSGNDAAIALAELVGGSEADFTTRMNETAQRLNMKGTHFANATGFPDPQHYSTARDLALLATALIHDFPEYYPLYSIREFRYNNITQSNRNRLLWNDPTVDGVKTGHTDTAGYCLVASARRGERRLVSVVLDAETDAARAAESQKLLNYGFQAYDSVQLYPHGKPVANIEVWKGASNTVPAGFPDDFYVSVPKGQADKLKASLESRQPLLAPISAGQVVGTLRLTLGGAPYLDVPVTALENVPLAGILGRGWDALRLLLK